MQPEPNRADELAEDAGQDETRRLNGNEREEIDSARREEKKGIFRSLRDAYFRGRQGRVERSQKQVRTAKTLDRSKGLMVLLIAVVMMIFVFLGLFSSSTTTKDRSAVRSSPNLGRPKTPQRGTDADRGSVTPLLNADTVGQYGNGDQVSPADVKATGRMHLPPPSAPGNTLGDIPPMDPALEAYRRERAGYTAPPPPVPPPSAPAPPVAPAAHNEADALKKASLVFVRSNSGAQPSVTRSASFNADPALLNQPARPLLPNGTRLVARLQSTVSTAVKAPVVAAIEYNYERDGEIIIPAGTKAFGELQQANRNGQVALRFQTLQMPDGSTEKIDAGAMSLSYGPLRGSVSGSNRLKRILVRSLTGVGTMAAYLVGGPGGFAGANGQLDNSILLRERIASNAGLAGEQEMSSLAYNENIVVTVPGNTRFFIVLMEPSGGEPPTQTSPARDRTQRTGADRTSPLPTERELRELIQLKSELNQIYRDAAAPQPPASPVTAQQGNQ
jgi:hypothetical protein